MHKNHRSVGAMAALSRAAAGVSEAKGIRPPSKPLIIGITGGMASGKSTLAKMFVGPGVVHVDADALVHRLMRHDRATIAALAVAFPRCVNLPPPSGGRSAPLGAGWGFLAEVEEESPTDVRASTPQPVRGRLPPLKGEVNRTALAAHIAQHPGDLAKLEAILHPRVRALEEKAILDATRQRLKAVILDVPLLFETGADQLCDVVIVAHAPLALRRARAFARPGMSEAKWQRLIERQLPDAERHARADLIIHTALGAAHARRAVQQLKKEWGLK